MDVSLPNVNGTWRADVTLLDADGQNKRDERLKLL